MKEELINKAYEIAKERYAAVGVDTEKVMETMQNFHLSLHCWQADDVTVVSRLQVTIPAKPATSTNYVQTF